MPCHDSLPPPFTKRPGERLGQVALRQPTLRDRDRRGRRRSLHFASLPLLALAKALRDRRSSGDQSRLIREALREIGVILLHDVEHGFLGKLSMVLGKKSVEVSELFFVHGHRASAATPKIYRNLLILRQLSACLVTCREPGQMGRSLPRRGDIGGLSRVVNHLLTMPA